MSVYLKIAPYTLQDSSPWVTSLLLKYVFCGTSKTLTNNIINKFKCTLTCLNILVLSVMNFTSIVMLFCLLDICVVFTLSCICFGKYLPLILTNYTNFILNAKICHVSYLYILILIIMPFKSISVWLINFIRLCYIYQYSCKDLITN